MTTDFHGRLIHGTRLLGEVTGQLCERLDSGGILRWSGFLQSTDQALDSGEVYRLYLDDGRSGEILLGAGSYEHGDNAGAVSFTGLGQLQ